ncbi:hypothetical protein FN846DRAFT_1004783, partial [Sphaerosporella brunnea]
CLPPPTPPPLSPTSSPPLAALLPLPPLPTPPTPPTPPPTPRTTLPPPPTRRSRTETPLLPPPAPSGPPGTFPLSGGGAPVSWATTSTCGTVYQRGADWPPRQQLPVHPLSWGRSRLPTRRRTKRTTRIIWVRRMTMMGTLMTMTSTLMTMRGLTMAMMRTRLRRRP